MPKDEQHDERFRRAVARGQAKAIVMGYFSSLYATSLMTWNPQTRRLMLRPEVQARNEIRKQMGRHVLFVRRQQ